MSVCEKNQKPNKRGGTPIRDSRVVSLIYILGCMKKRKSAMRQLFNYALLVDGNHSRYWCHQQKEKT